MTAVKTNEISVPDSSMTQIMRLDEASRSAALQLVAAETSGNQMAKALILSKSIQTLRNLLTREILSDLMQLQGTALGYRTDKDSDGGYREDVVRDVMVSALLRGLRPTGNEINIIAGNLYVTKEGFTRLLAELRGFADFQYQIGVPTTGDGGALVPAEASWTWQGVANKVEYIKTETADWRIAVRVNKSMGIDAIIGKATSKLLRRVYERCTGSAVGVDPDEPTDAPE